MPEIENDGARIWYTVSGPENAPAVLLLHSLGLTHELWDPQMPALRDAFRVIRYDARGHGRSSAPHGEFTIEMLGRDAIAVLDAADARTAAVCGILDRRAHESLARSARLDTCSTTRGREFRGAHWLGGAVERAHARCALGGH